MFSLAQTISQYSHTCILWLTCKCFWGTKDFMREILTSRISKRKAFLFWLKLSNSLPRVCHPLLLPTLEERPFPSHSLTVSTLSKKAFWSWERALRLWWGVCRDSASFQAGFCWCHLGLFVYKLPISFNLWYHRLFPPPHRTHLLC